MSVLTVKLFGREAELAGRREVCVRVPDRALTCADLARLLAEAEPSLGPTLAHCRFAVNHVFASDEASVGPDDEVALIGMVSGG